MKFKSQVSNASEEEGDCGKASGSGGHSGECGKSGGWWFDCSEGVVRGPESLPFRVLWWMLLNTVASSWTLQVILGNSRATQLCMMKTLIESAFVQNGYHRSWSTAWAWEANLSLNLSLTSKQLCVFGEITKSLQTIVSSIIKRKN